MGFLMSHYPHNQRKVWKPDRKRKNYPACDKSKKRILRFLENSLQSLNHHIIFLGAQAQSIALLTHTVARPKADISCRF